MVFRVYVEKRAGFDGQARKLAYELRQVVGIKGLLGVRVINRYDVQGISEALFTQCIPTVFSEPQSDLTRFDLPHADNAVIFAVEYLPGQFDQRAASASECIQLLGKGALAQVRTAVVYLLEGMLSENDVKAAKHYVINPIEAREASLERYNTLTIEQPCPCVVETLQDFLKQTAASLPVFVADQGLAMDAADARCVQRYFAAEGRNPTITELKVIDTYWSDHCRHTTFATELTDIVISDKETEDIFSSYLEMRTALGRDHLPITLMDVATIGARYLKFQGHLSELDESEEINACTVKARVDVDGKYEDWLYLFKNETHNHPTEIEPFGGAATCVGGAIRDPLSGRSYVYQAMRLSGAANPLQPLSDTLPGKLPQRTLVTTAAAGFSSYGNQVGLTTGQVHELYHPGYEAKRMEVGAVVAATPAAHVRREVPAAGDVVVLLGGRTGRDGIGGATGSSKAHDATSLERCGAEVQKGNAPVERRIQRLFRKGKVCQMIKRCNDFGAGGVSVAVGELAHGLVIHLDALPKKYSGLDGTELALSESQERMAVVLAPGDVDAFLASAHDENLEATVIAEVLDEARVRMVWQGRSIVDLARSFLDSNGAPKQQRVDVLPDGVFCNSQISGSYAQRLEHLVEDINVASNKGLVEHFDSTIGAASVLMPLGGIYQLTPALAMVAKLPVEGQTTTCSALSWGFNPYLSAVAQRGGSYCAVVESVCKLVASGFLLKDIYLSFQEYFARLGNSPTHWGKVLASLLGALKAQLDLGVAAIGGKDSMSGSFEDKEVPPSLISFATALGSVSRVTSPEFKQIGSRVVALVPAFEKDGITAKAHALRKSITCVEELIGSGRVRAVSTAGYGGAMEALFKMCVGNHIGLKFNQSVVVDDLFKLAYGLFIVELSDEVLPVLSDQNVQVIDLGYTTKTYALSLPDEEVDLAVLQRRWEGVLEEVFPYRSVKAATSDETIVLSSLAGEEDKIPLLHFAGCPPLVHKGSLGKPRVVIPVFPGTNCEYDSERAFQRVGALTESLVINTLTTATLAESMQAFVERIRTSQIIMIPGGFSGGDEPDGSAKFIAAFFRSPAVTEAVREFLFQRDGLMLGICNGFQALIKLGLVPFGDIRAMDAHCPTLTYNTIGRHQSFLVRTRVASRLSPWMSKSQVGDESMVPISHGEGRFVASDSLLASLAEAGQIASQYVDARGVPSMNLDVNPNGSRWAIEGMSSPDGRILGKMGHSERKGSGLYRNVPGHYDEPLFESGVSYFTT